MIVVFFIVQSLLRKTAAAKSFKGSAYDRGNMILIGATTGVGLWLPIIVDFHGLGAFTFDLVVGAASLVVMLLGVGLRIWAARTLGEYYTTALRVTEGQKVVSNGPYSLVRHPGYLAEIFIWTGLGVLAGSYLTVIVLPVMFISVLLYRISSEERMLVKELGDDYIQYQRRTHKLFPFIY